MDVNKSMGLPKSSDMVERTFRLVLIRPEEEYVRLVHNGRKEQYSFLISSSDFEDGIDLKEYSGKCVTGIFSELTDIYAVIDETPRKPRLLMLDGEIAPERARERLEKILGTGKGLRAKV